ncbi:hypothetical protein BN946_scf184943.g33 [Trametes cinnabarina]|uniref:Uncharacterized protein n=1 Tax=Pycnoporus cinnabarinus TaxID=5643 RepID=A0A060SHU0_PYCCI|nr:hypothetical protein BN946_scf184943.g33 [Trametes cinnabarina]
MVALFPYQGSVRKLVVAMDVGTTYSGVAYAILDPGEVPQIQGITRFPGQENAAGSSKIPSILYYRRDGTVHSVGAEAARPGIELEAEDEDLVFVEWFKLYLRPERLDSEEMKRRDLPPLPQGKSILDVFADVLRYLFACTKRYISETHANGESLWSSLQDRIEFVLSHPNGWEGLQQGKMRQAAVMAGLVPDTFDGHERIHFVTEGEASLQFCLRSGLATDVITEGESVMIVDAGGGTVDISTYTFTSTTPLAVEEIASADYRLKNSAYGNEEDIKAMLDYFDKSTKPIFKDSKDAAFIKFGTMKCNDTKVNIRRGQLTLTGLELESFFSPSLEAIVNAVLRQHRAATRIVSGARVREQEEISESYHLESPHATGLSSVSAEIIGYRGGKQSPRWMDVEPECFNTLCTIFADTSKVRKLPCVGKGGVVYFIQKFDVVLMCGLTELKAQIRWTENGEEKRGPAKIVYDDDIQLVR